MRPGVDVVSRALPAPILIPTDTGVSFVIGPTGAASTEIVGLVLSLTDYINRFGERMDAPVTYDAVDAFFREGGSKLYVASTTKAVIDPPVTFAAGDSFDSMSRAELDRHAEGRGLNPSDYGTKNDLLAALREESTASQAEQDVAAAAQDNEATLLLADPGIAAALSYLNRDLGPGQVFIADPVLAAVAENQAALLAHAVACNRVALLSTVDAVDITVLTAAAEAIWLDGNGRYGAVFGPSAIIPGLAPGTTRTVPWTAIQAGIISRNDTTKNPNEAAAGTNGVSLYAIDLLHTYTDAEYAALNESGWNAARKVYGVIEAYGYRAFVDPAGPGQVWLEFGHARLNMGIVAGADAIGERYVFKQLDGRRRLISDFGSELAAMLVPLYEDGALYGATPQEAFDVNVGPQINTEETIANGELHAIISVRMSHMSEWVLIEIVKVATTQALASSTPSALAA